MPKTCHTQGSSLLWCLCLHTWKGLLAATIVIIPALVGPNNYLRFTYSKLKSMKKLDDEKSIRKCIPHWGNTYGSLFWSFLICAQLLHKFFCRALGREGLPSVPKATVSPLLHSDFFPLWQPSVQIPLTITSLTLFRGEIDSLANLAYARSHRKKTGSGSNISINGQRSI